MRRLHQANQRLHRFERDADAGEMGKGICGIVPVRVDHGIGRREKFARLMMVCDNDRHAEAVGIRHGFPRLNAAVRGNDKRRALLFRPINRLRLDVVAVVFAMRYAVNEFRAQGGQCAHIERRAGDAVYVIVAMHKDRLAICQRVFDAMRGPVHIRQAERVMQLTQIRPQKGIGGSRIGQPSVTEQPGSQRVYPHFTHQRLFCLRVPLRLCPEREGLGRFRQP